MSKGLVHIPKQIFTKCTAYSLVNDTATKATLLNSKADIGGAMYYIPLVNRDVSITRHDDVKEKMINS